MTQAEAMELARKGNINGVNKQSIPVLSDREYDTYFSNHYLDYTTDVEEKKTEIIEADEFFNISHPESTFIEIDFWVNNQWVKLNSVSNNQNNFFRNMQIEDNGGTKKLTLNLVDKDFYNLESLITSSIATTQKTLNEKGIPNKEYTSRETNSISEDKTESYPAKTEKINYILTKYGNFKGFKNNPSSYFKDINLSKEYLINNVLKIFCDFTIDLIENHLIEISKQDGLNKDQISLGAKRKLTLLQSPFPSQAESMIQPFLYSKVFGRIGNLTVEQTYGYFTAFVILILNNKNMKIYKDDSGRYARFSDEYKSYVDNVRSIVNNILSEISELDYISSKVSQELIELRKKNEDEAGLFTVANSNATVISNIRIKFGHSDYNPIVKYNKGVTTYKNKFMDYSGSTNWTTTEQGDQKSFLNRINTVNVRTLIRSPFYEFMITSVQSKIDQIGLSYTLSGFSVTSETFDNYKLVQRYAKIKGTPKKMLYDLMKVFNETLKDYKDNSSTKRPNIELHVSRDTKIQEEKDQNGLTKEIEVMLGSESNNNQSKSYQSLRSFFNDFCAAMPKLIDNSKAKTITRQSQDENGKDIIITEETGIEEYPLTYKIVQLGDVSHVVFYYKKPKKVPYIRNYNWGATTKTIVKDLEVSNKNEYATLASYSVYYTGEDKLIINSVGNKDPEDLTKRQTIIGNDLKNKVFLTNNVMENNNSTKIDTFTKSIKEALKNSLYEGTLTIPGDPFYCFDDSMVPYMYPIKLSVWINDFSKNETGRIDSAENVKLSYMSGYYVITNIVHTISASGFTTTLSIMKYPGIENLLQ